MWIGTRDSHWALAQRRLIGHEHFVFGRKRTAGGNVITAEKVAWERAGVW
jgi:hypothetical protein